jgi:hypothetical protein
MRWNYILADFPLYSTSVFKLAITKQTIYINNWKKVTLGFTISSNLLHLIIYYETKTYILLVDDFLSFSVFSLQVPLFPLLKFSILLRSVRCSNHNTDNTMKHSHGFAIIMEFKLHVSGNGKRLFRISWQNFRWMFSFHIFFLAS